ncbi:MAG: hypothetical protein HY885_09045 [Deltaproteobacteria bacterium]|nr:hypothetical protein [Deltaproteobacteria bacterium]
MTDGCMVDFSVRTDSITQPRVGRLVVRDQAGEVWVEWQGAAPRPARYLASVPRGDLVNRDNHGREVLLVFAEGDCQRPVIVGLLGSILDELVQLDCCPEDVQAAKPCRVKIDEETVTLEAEREVVLKCGKGSITIRRDGKIIIKGTHILSRSSGPQRIKGGHVEIN